MSTAEKILLSEKETAEALAGFDVIKLQGPNVSQVAHIRRLLCGVTAKLVCAESELALEEERKRQ